MKKQTYLFGLLGLIAGLALGYLGTNYLNRHFAPAATQASATDGASDLPPGHPATPASGGAETASSGASGASGGGPQGDVAATIQQARNEPGNVDLQLKAANLFKQIGRSEGALEFYERAQQARPNDVSLLTNLGNLNFDLKKYADAEKWYRLAIKAAPKDPALWLDLGSTYYLREPRDLAQAAAAYRSALQIDARNEKALQNLTRVLLDQGDKRAATETLGLLEKVNSNNPSVQAFRAELK